ncbi:hypothetical protein GF354_06480 [Candidatus Peregrinibacteria bacterium]|nr:hypothetical protein [Candidatus Peregrinibacteria bacterium]
MQGKKEERKDKKSLELVYKELSDAWEFQRSSIDTIHSKSNWLMALNATLIAALSTVVTTEGCGKILIIFTLVISLLFSVANLWLKEIARGADLDELFIARNQPYEKLLDAVCEKKKSAIERNNPKLKNLKDCLKISIAFLVMGIVLIFLNLIT